MIELSAHLCCIESTFCLYTCICFLIYSALDMLIYNVDG